MAKTGAFYSALKTDRNVHHDNTSCTEGNNIEAKNRRDGTGGYPLCEHCKKLS